MSKLGICGAILIASSFLIAQQIDSNITSQSRKPLTIAEQISDASERRAFQDLFAHVAPQQKFERARAFLTRFPRSAFLFQVYEIGARACFELQDYDSGLDYAKESLKFLPENPLLLVSVADVEARQHRNEAAITHAQEALENLDRFAAPSTVAPENWLALKRKLKATAEFAKGRAFLAKALELPKGEPRNAALEASEGALLRAQSLNSSDTEIPYLLGLAQLASEQWTPAASSFAFVYDAHDNLGSKAFGDLKTIYEVSGKQEYVTFDQFLQSARELSKSLPLANEQAKKKQAFVGEYAGSEACRGCHGAIYSAWSQTGMSKMLRPYAAANVIGDFDTNNEFFRGNDARYEDGTVQQTRDPQSKLFARMLKRHGRHYFDLLQSDGTWHSYPVDYTIGSKFQQAYATKLPNGEIHVLPIQYSKLTQQWINYWQIIDGPRSERADLTSWEKLNAATSYQAICAVCHTSQLRNTRSGGFDLRNLDFKEPGIDCEMCHGPSAQHVAEMAANQPFPKEALDTPVNFHDVSNRDFVRICSQCHMQSAIRTPGSGGELNYSRSGQFFIDNLSIPFGEFSRLGFYKDGRFRQTTFVVEALERSQCFKKGQVSCGTCHNPHPTDASTNLKSLKFRDHSDQMCTSCHSQFGSTASLTAHSHHPPESEGSRCVSCHMPRIMDAVLFRARTHQIDDIPDAEMTERFGQQESPNACLLCHADKNLGWLKQQLARWKSTPQG
jgi:tetratricopeptide (TPR) repeat protein